MQLLLQFHSNLFETLHVFCSWSGDVHVVLNIFSYFFQLVHLVILGMSGAMNGS